MKFHTVKGADFMNAGGKHIVSLQMVSDENGKAYAVADFRGEKLERFDSASSCIADARVWVADCIHLMSL